jgi:hypothetical protein
VAIGEGHRVGIDVKDFVTEHDTGQHTSRNHRELFRIQISNVFSCFSLGHVLSPDLIGNASPPMPVLLLGLPSATVLHVTELTDIAVQSHHSIGGLALDGLGGMQMKTEERNHHRTTVIELNDQQLEAVIGSDKKSGGTKPESIEYLTYKLTEVYISS